MCRENNIQIITQPDWISDDEIADVLHDAHRKTLQAGMHYAVLNQNGTEIRKRLGSDGVFFVALLDGKELIGVSGISFYEKENAWYAKGKKLGEIKLEGVRSDHQGHGINGMLHKAIYEYAFNKVDVLMTHTSVKNKTVLHADRNRGWKYVDFGSWHATDYYSIVMAKWKAECPYSDLYRMLRYHIRKTKTLLVRTKHGDTRGYVDAAVKLKKRFRKKSGAI